MIKVKPCPICGVGKLRMTHYALPMKYHPDVWKETDDCLFEPVATVKRIECSNCGATTWNLHMPIQDAIKEWNEEDENGNRSEVLQYIIDEDLKVENE